MNITFVNYQISQELHESVNSLVYRAQRQVDNQPVILKILKQAYPPPEKTAQFRREYELTRSLNSPNVVKAYSLEIENNQQVMVLEDFGGASLAQLLRIKNAVSLNSPLLPDGKISSPYSIQGKREGSIGSLEDFLRVAIDITSALGQIHQKYIIHKDINPSNILFNSNTKQIKIIDFGISTVLSRENATFRNPKLLEGTLAYISPEQTGRMNRAIDYRTDFYSLGVTFYELLTGQLPFPTDDVLELIHSHISKQPSPPHELKPDIPQAISEIILKLMSKNAEDRYQSINGIIADLEGCLQQWQAKKQIEPFVISQRDISDKFQIPQKLYGREAEIEALMTAIERVGQGTSEMMLVSGYSGIGKSALVQEIYKPLTRVRGYFISGKFDQFQRNIPYASIVQAFRSLIVQLLTESETQIVTWRQKLLVALGSNGKAIIEVIPEVEFIIGPQPEIPVLGPNEAQNRFNIVFQNFIKVFTKPEHPLVIFLDDLQWADGASLKLIQLLMTATDSKYLFLIGAYRDNEVSAAHPLMLTIDEIEKTKAIVNKILLTPLEKSHVNELIADCLHIEPAMALPLGELVRAKTGGNPFFITEFLKSLYAEELLAFDYSVNCWQWNIGQIQVRQITDNVVELMAGKVQKLAPETQAVLKLAACVGNQFDLETLAIVYEKSARETATDLWAAIASSLILPLNDAYKLMELDVEGLANNLAAEYRFAHDRIQQAVYSLIPETDKQAVHLRIGQLLLQNTPLEEQDRKIFDIVNHLNQGQTLIYQPIERDRLAQLNLQAGKKAKASAAYQPAFSYLQFGLGLLIEDSWQMQYELTLELYVEAAEAAYLNANFEVMDRLNKKIIKQANSLLDQVKVYQIQLLAHLAQNNLKEALQTALEVLTFLDIALPLNPSESDINVELEEIKMELTRKSIEDLIELPLMIDKNKLAALKILNILFSIAFKVAPQLLPLCVFKQVKLSLKYGNAPESPYAYACYGLILCGIFGDIDAGYAFGELALKLLSRSNNQKFKAATFDIVNCATVHWKKHITNTLKPLQEGYQAGLETGDLEFGCYCALAHCNQSYFTGQELTQLEIKMKNYREIIFQFKQKTIVSNIEVFWQTVLNLIGRSENPIQLVGEAYDEEKMLPLHLETTDRSAIYYLSLNKLVLCYLFGAYSQAVEVSTRAEEYLDGTIGMIPFYQFHSYDSLARLAVFPDAPETEKERILEKVAANQEKLETWARHAPMNYLHKYYLVEAERARVLGNYSDAREHYDRAISLAHENEYLNEEALAYELAGRFYLSRNQTHIARHYLQDAHYAYQTWGAVAKVKDLEARYPQFVISTSSKKSGFTTTSSTTGSSSGEAIDLATVVKASQAIAGEIVLDKLLAKLIDLALQNAGAQTGYLILSNNGELFIEAEASGDRPVQQVLQSLPVNTSQNLPLGIINYVARTQENIVLSDATKEGIFTADPYITTKQPKSILCAPIINQGKLVGLLYLENNIAIGAFTSDRLEVVKILSSQAAISLENAILYRTLEQKVIERTAQLADANQEITHLNELLKAENIRMSAELDVTRQLQQMILPKESELLEIPSLEIAGFMEPADEVGGDYYDVLKYGDNIKIGIGDVTGHGLASGVLMIMAQTAVRTLEAAGETDPIKFLNIVNRTLYDNVMRMNSDKNMSLSLLDYSDNILRLSGQHEEILIVRSGTEVERIDTMDLGFPIGLESDIADFVAQTEISLNAGDVVVLYTDGITEAENLEGVQYGLERLMEVITGNGNLSASEIKQMVIDDVRRHIGEQKVYDDITLVVLKQK